MKKCPICKSAAIPYPYGPGYRFNRVLHLLLIHRFQCTRCGRYFKRFIKPWDARTTRIPEKRFPTFLQCHDSGDFEELIEKLRKSERNLDSSDQHVDSV